MRCLYVTQELAPYFVEGGLGLTAANLPKTLAREHAVPHTVILPFYPRLASGEATAAEEVASLGPVSLGGRTWHPTLLRIPGVRDPEVLLVRCDDWYARDGGIYRDPDYVEYPDAVPRAVFFGWCVARWVNANPGRYALVHANDWQSGAAVFLLAFLPRPPAHPAPRLLFNIHNGQYRGAIPAGWSDLLPQAGESTRAGLAAWPRDPSLLALGLLAADAFATCSPTYAREFVGALTDPPVRERVGRLGITGIVSGVDGAEWNPDRPRTSVRRYTPATVQAGKRVNKRALQERCGLRTDGQVPLAAVCSRLVPEKGVDQILDGLAPLIRAGRLQLVVVGRGEPRYHRSLRGLAEWAPGMVFHHPDFTFPLAHLVYAGADFTLMPSLVEPCGLNQLIAMRYGTLPVVHPVGGLNDTVTDVRGSPGDGTGFVASRPGTAGFRAVTEAALDWLTGNAPSLIRRTRQRAMRADWSWRRTAVGYADLYQRILAGSGTGEGLTAPPGPARQHGRDPTQARPRR